MPLPSPSPPQDADDGCRAGLAKRRHELEQAELAQGHDGRTLWEQLEANKEKKDEEWKAVNNPFAPPPGLADDEAEYIDGLEAQKRDFDKRKKAQKDEDTAAFKAAQAQRVVQSGTAGDAVRPPPTPAHPSHTPASVATWTCSQRPGLSEHGWWAGLSAVGGAAASSGEAQGVQGGVAQGAAAQDARPRAGGGAAAWRRAPSAPLHRPIFLAQKE